MARTKNIKGISKIVILGLTALVLIVLLNYLNIFTLPFLQSKVAIACPVPKEFCDKGKVIIANGKVVGIGFTLLPGSPLSASLEGTAQLGVVQDGKTKEKRPIVWLYGKGKLEGYVATYNFYGTPLTVNTSSLSQQNIKEKESLGYMGYGNFPKEAPYNGVNFIFSLHKDNKTTPPLPLSAFEFK